MATNCGVCLEDRAETDYEILPCSHKLCNSCFPRLLKKECPFCRNPFQTKKKEDILDDITHDVININIIEDRVYNRLERRQRRRMRRRENNRIRLERRNSNPGIPIAIFQLEEENIENEPENTPRNHKSKKQERNKNLRKSERWNNLRNQRSLQHI
tara:strand:- start:151 stop:618 length:468 start_codon:yes stop_codon:yes gene_type:complete